MQLLGSLCLRMRNQSQCNDNVFVVELLVWCLICDKKERRGLWIGGRLGALQRIVPPARLRSDTRHTVNSKQSSTLSPIANCQLIMGDDQGCV